MDSNTTTKENQMQVQLVARHIIDQDTDVTVSTVAHAVSALHIDVTDSAFRTLVRKVTREVAAMKQETEDLRIALGR